MSNSSAPHNEANFMDVTGSLTTICSNKFRSTAILALTETIGFVKKRY